MSSRTDTRENETNTERERPKLAYAKVGLMSTQPNPDVRTWCMLCHLAVFVGLTFPFGGVLGPLLVWQLRKRELPELEVHGRAAVNFQLTMLLLSFVVCALWLALFGASFLFTLLQEPKSFSPSSFAPFVVGWLVFPALLGVIHLSSWLFAVIAGVKANNDESYAYPFAIPFFKKP